MMAEAREHTLSIEEEALMRQLEFIQQAEKLKDVLRAPTPQPAATRALPNTHGDCA